jgi:hypothetical protein
LLEIPNELVKILNNSFLIRISIKGRKTKTLRVVELTYYWDGDKKIYLSGYPGKRDWIANMKTHQNVILHTVEFEPKWDISSKARIVENQEERITYILNYIERWSKRPGYPRFIMQISTKIIKLNKKLKLPWWGPFWFAKRILNQMPCVEIEFKETPKIRKTPVPSL